VGVASGDIVTLDNPLPAGRSPAKTVGTGKAVTIGGIAIGGV